MSYIFIQGQEQFKPIIGYPEYEIGDHGNVRSLKFGKVRLLKPIKNSGGYLQVFLFKNGKYKNLSVHRIVATHFIPNPANKPEVNHKFGDKTDNMVCSLEWVTKEQNQHHAWANGLKEKVREAKTGENNGNCKLTDEDVNKIRIRYATGNVTQKDLAKEYEVSQSRISEIINNKSRSSPTPSLTH